MAKKKAKKRKGKRRSPAQMRALRKMIAARKASLRKKGGSKKRRKSPKRRRKSHRQSVAHHMRSANRRGFQPQSSGTASHYHSGARSYAAGIAAGMKKRRGRRRRKHHAAKAGHGARKHGNVVTAADILRNAKSKRMKVWSCAGMRRTGCGGGKRGGHVVGHLR